MQMRWLGWLLAAGLPAGGCGAWAQTAAAVPERFEAATIKPDTMPGQHFGLSMSRSPEFTATQVSLTYLVCLAYELSDYQVVNRPAWMDTEYFDITAHVKGNVGLSYQQLQKPLQALLKERFHLTLRRGTKVMDGYELVVGAGGAKLKQSVETTEHGMGLPGMIRVTGAPMDTVVRALARQLAVPVKDRTGLKGLYDATLRFDPKNQGNARQPSIFQAVEEQLGLKLVPAKVSVETVAVEHADRTPVEN